MRSPGRIAVALAIFILSGSVVNAQPVAAEKHFASTSHDFGTVPRGAQLLHKFAWTNGEKSRLEITDIRITCACATAVPVPRALEPGQKGEIEVLVDAKKFVGQKDVQLHVTLSGETKHAAMLRISVHCRPDVVYNPGEVNFGIVPAGGSAGQQMEIEYAGKLDWKVEELINTNPHLEAAIEEMYRKPGEVGYRLRVNLKPDAPAGDFKHELQLRVNDPGLKVIPVLVQGTIRARLAATPASVTFGSVKVGQQAVRRVVLRGDKPFAITELAGLPAGVSVSKPSRPAAVQTLTLTWTPTASGELNAPLVVHTDLDKVTIPVPLHGQTTP
jgi:hypothetical protein